MADDDKQVGESATEQADRSVSVDWDAAGMATTYANVVNVSSTREEVSAFFGTNQTFNPGGAQDFKVKLSNRVILSPYAAKRLYLLLGGILREYESRFGELRVGPAKRDA